MVEIFALKPLYPMTREVKTGNIDISIDDINKATKDDDDNRWIEMPMDWTLLSLNEIDAKIKDKKYILEIRVEQFDQHREMWPSEIKDMNPIQKIITTPRNDVQETIPQKLGNLFTMETFTSMFCKSEEAKISEFEEFINSSRIGDIDGEDQCFIRYIEVIFNDEEKENQTMFTVHYIGYSTRYDLKLPANDQRMIAKRYTNTDKILYNI